MKTQDATTRYGTELFQLVEASPPPSVFSPKGFYGSLMNWALKDQHFKTQLFRFVDVLPTLTSASEITRHLQEYLGEDQVKLPPALRLGLAASGTATWLVGSGIKAQVAGMARQFLLGENPKEILQTLHALHRREIAFTVDVLGEVVVSETEADHYAQKYLDLIAALAPEVARWRHPCQGNAAPDYPRLPLNISVKISALYSQIHPADPQTAVNRICERLRPILRRAAEYSALINIDMENYYLKDLTLQLFKTIFAEPEFSRTPARGIALQAYLREGEQDLRDLINWARQHRQRVTIRLVKGAYWDYETMLAGQRRWPVPVFSRKAETDHNFEKLATLVLEHSDVLDPAFGTHNIRSIAHVLAEGDRLKLDRKAYEFQMLYGMAEPIQNAVVQMGCRLRDYCPVGELLPGIAYFVRRLLENTSNEGFLASRFGKGVDPEQLLRDPAQILDGLSAIAKPTSASGPQFQNQPLTDFRRTAERERLQQSLHEVRQRLGRKHPLVVNHREVSTRDWLTSLNPADQAEVIGYAAQAGLKEADQALDAALQAFPLWKRTPTAQRCKVLHDLAEQIRQERFQLCALEILEAGKNWEEADADVAEAIDFCEFYARAMEDLAEPRITQPVPGETNHQHWWPRGTGIVIAPWNFPLAILTGMTAAAVVAGNTVIIKPSDQTPVIGARLMELFMKAGLPPGVVNLLTGPGSTVGAHLVGHPRIDFVAFTGSREVGLRIWEQAGRTAPGQPNLKKVVCEMGGKNCVIVDSDADLDEAVAGCIASAFGYQGQKCSALSRLVVLEQNYDLFVERLIAAAASLRVGPAEHPGTLIGPVISREAQQRILKMIEAGRKEATLAWQGTVPDAPQACYVPSAIFTDVPPAGRLFQEEIFGPVLAITKARDMDHALELANHSEFALTGGIYSRSPCHIERARNELVCGNLYINRPITGALVERQPFGGFKMSGGGTKAGGREYLQNFLVPRVITENALRRGFAPEEAQP